MDDPIGAVVSFSIRRRKAVRESWLLRYATPPGRVRVGWEEFAACKGMGIDVFFPTTTIAASNVAYEICARCPVRLACLHDAFVVEAGGNTNHIFGIKGGLSPSARREFLEAHPHFRPHRQEQAA